MKILAFSDVHGNLNAITKLIDEISDKEYDFIIFGGDFTNAWFDGPEKGQIQMNNIISYLECLEKPFYYVYGNRDIFVECKYGNNIGDKDWRVGKYILTNNVEGLNKSKILVTHSLIRNLKETQSNSLLYLYGHDHVGRVYKNYIDLGFLYRGIKAHGAAQALYGCYWLINIENNKINPVNYSWQLKETRCPLHRDQGIFYIPHYWRKPCPLCYDEEANRLNF